MMPAEPRPFEGDTAERYGVEHLDVRWPAEWKATPGWRPYNPSLAWHGGRLFCSVRYSFFAWPGLDTTGQVLVSSNYYGVSETILAELDPTTKQVLWWVKLEPRGFGSTFRNRSLEDVRLYSTGTELRGIGVHLNTENPEPSQAVVVIDPEKGTLTLDRVLPNNGRPEKNWSPVEGRPGTFAYSTTEWVTDQPGTSSVDDLHGGTQLIRHGDRYLSLVHSFENRRYLHPSARGRRGRHYFHHWAEWDQGRIVRLTPAFVFKWEAAIEFASGLVRDGDRLLVSWGWGDYDLSLSSFDPDRVNNELQPWSTP